ncbi:MAG TPA: helix-turn-helix domain-containing protein [Ferruginibacter sp.]|nr:helix-turn-helix domain-containing protein [Ferruginibacter sp.]
MQNPDETNIIFKTASLFINNTSHPVFLTGKAGTGKTTFLKFIRENTQKNTAIVAPTGVAAINAGGTTIHSFFHLPFGPFLPVNKTFGDAEVVDKHSLLSKIKLGTERKELMQQLELLIIDEISMVRCDVLDAIDFILRHIRNRFSVPFGGVQVLYIGDMYQLPPVIKGEEWEILSSCYSNPFFFNSQVVKENPPVYIELQKVYRQHDQDFISLLNQVRNNELTDVGYSLLHSRFLAGYKPVKNEKVITLTTHNNKADAINIASLASLSQPLFSFEASIIGEFSEKLYPADPILQIKNGAQVMFIKNDTEKIRRYFNGKIGIISKIETDNIWVNIETDGIEKIICVKKEAWENIRYSLNKKSNQIEEEVIGSFSQFPLRLAWAITIHKSQGLTFQNAVIDAEKAFAPGQVYVALSRCTTLEGIVLKTKISPDSLRSDERIVTFTKRQHSADTQDEILKKASHQYQCETILNLVDFQKEENSIRDFSIWLKDNPVFGDHVNPWVSEVRLLTSKCYLFSTKFKNELLQYFSNDAYPEDNLIVQERLRNASRWFHNELLNIKKLITRSPAITDNRQNARDYNKKLDIFINIIGFHLHILSSSFEKFSMENMLAFKKSFIKEGGNIDSYSGKKEYLPGETDHPDLYHELKDKRNELCERYHSPAYMICSFKGIQEMVNYLPDTITELALINGFGPARIKKFGTEFIEIIKNYCENNGLKSSMPSQPIKPRKKDTGIKNDTKKISFELYRSGKNIEDIARTRNLTAGTIQEHLVAYIESGEIEINDLIPKAKLQQLSEVINQSGNLSLQKIKESLPDATYTEIKWFIASEKFLANH